MPKMNGIELIRRLKKDMNTSHIPIIMVTAKTGTDDIKEGYAAGADEYITKPFDASILKIRVDNLIQSREKLKELYSKNFSLESLGVDVTSVDEKFMQKAICHSATEYRQFGLKPGCLLQRTRTKQIEPLPQD